MVRFMRRWCCLALATSCCAECRCVDPDATSERHRGAIVRTQRAQRAELASCIDETYRAKQAAVDAAVASPLAAAKAGGAAPSGREPLSVADAIAARRAARPRVDWRGCEAQEQEQRPPNVFAQGLPEADRAELQREREGQDDCLERLDHAVLAQAIGEEMQNQDPKLERLEAGADAANCGLTAIARDAGQLLGRRVETGSGAMLRRQTAAAAAGLRAAAGAARAGL
eukprot:scaffold1.g5553.t1